MVDKSNANDNNHHDAFESQPSFSESSSEDDSAGSDADNSQQLEGTSTTERDVSRLEERDEVREIKEASRADTVRIRRWRFIMTWALLITAIAVTLSTFILLKREEDDKFETAVRIRKHTQSHSWFCWP